MLTRVNGRITDNVRNDLLNVRSQTCSLQVDRVASFHRLEQVSANLGNRQRSALTYNTLGKQRQKELRWQKCLKYKLKAQNLATSHSQKAIRGYWHIAVQRSSPKHFVTPNIYLIALPACKEHFSLEATTSQLERNIAAWTYFRGRQVPQRKGAVQPPQRLATACL